MTIEPTQPHDFTFAEATVPPAPAAPAAAPRPAAPLGAPTTYTASGAAPSTRDAGSLYNEKLPWADPPTYANAFQPLDPGSVAELKEETGHAPTIAEQRARWARGMSQDLQRLAKENPAGFNLVLRQGNASRTVNVTAADAHGITFDDPATGEPTQMSYQDLQYVMG